MDLVKFLAEAGKLKAVRRQGWIERGVKKPESVADHCFGTALACMVVPGDVDRDKAIRMALVHDLAEARVGDIITKESWSGGSMRREEKLKLEGKALRIYCPASTGKPPRRFFRFGRSTRRVRAWRPFSSGTWASQR